MFLKDGKPRKIKNSGIGLTRNIKHLEEHVKSFTKIQAKIEDLHAAQSLQNAIKLLKQGVLELKNVLTHLNE